MNLLQRLFGKKEVKKETPTQNFRHTPKYMSDLDYYERAQEVRKRRELENTLANAIIFDAILSTNNNSHQDSPSPGFSDGFGGGGFSGGGSGASWSDNSSSYDSGSSSYDSGSCDSSSSSD